MHYESRSHPFQLTGWRALSVVTLMLLSAIAQAHQACVNSAAQLQSALNQAAVTSDEGTYINIVKGTYKTTDLESPSRFLYQSSIVDPTFYIVVRGGWNADCTVRVPEPYDTILDGDHATQVLVIRMPAGFVQVYGLTIQNGETNQPGAGLAINELGNDNSDVTISTNIIRNNHTTAAFGGFRAFGKGSNGAVDNMVTVRNNLVYGNSADQGDGAGEAVGGSGGVVINNNTITQNTTLAANGVGGLALFGTCTIANNILWGNMNSDLFISLAGAHVDYNDLGTRGGANPGELTGNVNVDPIFVDPMSANFHLAAESPLLGFSPLVYPLNYPYTDLDGNQSPLSGRMDAGAYQETVFTDGFTGGSATATFR